MTCKTTDPIAPRLRAPWSAPRIARLAAGDAENGLNPTREDGVFSRGS